MIGTQESVSTIQDFQEQCNNILSAFEQICDDLFLARIAAVRERIHHEKLKVLVVGEFSRGKSTLINALIGKPVLPSKVNPTTATINVLNGSTPAIVRILYADGHSEQMPLPKEQINKYLDGLVTTKNKDAHTISVVTLQIPGRLGDMQLEIVDTPGVNELDEAREDITYQYLRHADAAILLLDAQQPLNKSEKLFLTHKIFKNDIRRVLFVVNKIDEVLSGGSESDIPRIVEFVRSRLREEVGIDAEVFAISAKNALRARFKDEPDSGPGKFNEFESELLRFAQVHASGERWHLHIERIQSLIRDQIVSLQQQCASVTEDLVKDRKNIEILGKEDGLIDSAVKRLDTTVKMKCIRLSQQVGTLAYEEVEKLRSELLRKLQACSTVEDVQRFRTEMSAELRDVFQRIENFAGGFRSEMIGEIEREFRSALSERTTALEKSAHEIDVAALVPVMPALSVKETQAGNLDWKALAGGVGMGFLAANLFGIVGLVASVISGLCMSKSDHQTANAQLRARTRQQLVANLELGLAELSTRARKVGEQIGAAESDRLNSHIVERAAQRRESVKLTIESSRKALCATANEREILRSTWVNRLEILTKLETQCLALA